MDANQQSQHDTSKSGPSKPRGKARARSKSLVELPAEMPAPQPSAPSPVLRKIPRPPNAFILYRSHKMRELKNQKDPSALVSTGLDKLDYQRNLSKVIGQLWREETESVKETFFAKAKQAAKEHSERYPEYRSKSSGTKKDPQEAESSILDSTPEKQQHTDFSPGDISGPLSGSGSGSGRKRASLDGARSRASPYSASRHRRTSSTAPASPTARHSTGQAAQQHAPVLLYTPDDPQATSLCRSLSYGLSSHYPVSPRRSSKSPARRSLDGHLSYAASTANSFETLVPQHLRQPQVFLAPLPAPPIPIGQAITSDEAVSTAEPLELQPGHLKPKRNLFEAVKSALPPERRAFLQTSLAMRGLAAAMKDEPSSPVLQSRIAMTDFAVNHQTQEQSAPSAAQAEAWNSTSSSAYDVGNQYDPYAQGVSSGLSSQNSSTEQSSSQPDALAAEQNTLYQAQQQARYEAQYQAQYQPQSYTESHAGPSINVHMGASVSQSYGGLADWTPHDPCWVDYSHPQQAATSADDPQSAYGQPSFTYVDAPPSAYYGANSSNSAFVALSEPNEAGQVQGSFYSFDGQLVGQGTVNGSDNSGLEYLDEETRQRRALDQLLMQMMDPSLPNSCPPLQPELIGESAPHTHSSTEIATPPDGDSLTQQEAASLPPATVDPTLLQRGPSSQPESGTSQQSIQQSLRNWKANHLISLKDKLSRVKHRASPSASSPSAQQS